MTSYSVAFKTEKVVVSVADIKAHLRITHAYEDAVIDAYADAAIISAENYTGRYIHLYDVVGKSATFGDAAIIEHGPVNGDIVITYYDLDNSIQTLDDSYYDVMIFNGEPEIVYNPVLTLPSVYNRNDAVIVTYQAGYVTVPEPFKMYVKLVTAFLYENRSDSVDKLPRFTQTIIRPYKRWQ